MLNNRTQPTRPPHEETGYSQRLRLDPALCSRGGWIKNKSRIIYLVLFVAWAISQIIVIYSHFQLEESVENLCKSVRNLIINP